MSEENRFAKPANAASCRRSGSGLPGSSLSGLIAFRAAMYDGSGYADEARGIVFALHRAGVSVHLQPFGLQHDAQSLLTAEEREILETLKHQSIDMDRGVYFQHCPAHDFNVFMRCRHLVGRTMYETDSIPDGWRDHCEAMDEVWVPGKFNCETFASAGVARERLHALPGGIDTNLFHPDAEPFAIPQRRGFNFLSVFEWIDRKGADILLRAYLSEFKADEDVALILKTYGRPEAHADMLPQLAYMVERQFGMRLEDTPPIILLTPDFLSAAELPRLYASADAFVLPTRGEGWGRPFMEALACGCPVIATRWSGQMEFLNDDICYLADCELRPVPWNNDVELSAGHQWAEVRVEHLRKLMRQVFEHRDEAKHKGLRGRAAMASGWQWDDVIRKYWIPEFERLLS
jgi:glycosyltransferase involved in cell wall biosynthesis